jgi:Lipid desaturase domain
MIGTTLSMEARPLYLDCNRSQALTAWCGAAANGMVITWLGLWLVIHYPMVDPNFVGLIIAVFLALFISDFFSGFVHWTTDTWFDQINWQRVISIAREHHLFPHSWACVTCSKAACAKPAIASVSPHNSSRPRPVTTSGPTVTIAISLTSLRCKTRSTRTFLGLCHCCSISRNDARGPN